ncbi:MAG: protein kinase [Acidobacteriota bacterium]|nr:protein kinase [Acidobacteriota bacterium]
MSENTPKQIGDYVILRELGHGGMGKVYQVRNVLSDRIEAMKVVLPDLAGRSEFVSRFMREIKVLASLEHPNIAALRTAFTSGDQFVMIMEYVEGVTLGDRLEQGAISPADAMNYIDQVLSALSYAHSKHIIHRDIKPANMMLTPQGVVKLMDFGLARSADEVGLTMTGSTVGSLDYLSPEQVQSRPTDERSDLYSVGVSLYQMVTHQRMFSATSSYSIMEAHVKETPRSPIELVPSLPKPVSDLMMMSVAKNPAERFQTADAFRSALSQVKDLCPPSLTAPTAATITLPASQAVAAQPAMESRPSQSVPVVPPPVAQPVVTQSGRGGVIAVVAVLVLLVLAGAWYYRSRQNNQQIVAGMPVAQNTGNGVPQPPSPPTEQPLQAVPPAAAPVGPVSSQGPEQTQSSPAGPTSSQPPQPTRSRRAVSTANAGMQPGGASLDQPPQQAVIDQKKLLDDLERESDQVNGRAAAVESSLSTLERQMQNQGLGLRGDMVAARNNMHNDLAKAKQALDVADTERAKHFLELANREVEKLEAFMGHR